MMIVPLLPEETEMVLKITALIAYPAHAIYLLVLVGKSLRLIVNGRMLMVSILILCIINYREGEENNEAENIRV